MDQNEVVVLSLLRAQATLDRSDALLGAGKPWNAIMCLDNSEMEVRAAGLYELVRELASCSNGCSCEDVATVLGWFQEWIDSAVIS